MITVSIPRDLAYQMLDALCMRARWYEVRHYATPDHVTRAIRLLSRELGVDASEVGR